MKTIEDLRRFAELNLCKDCFYKYKALIEPTIENWLSKPLSDWRQTESYVTQVVMKTRGVFKGKKIPISFDKGEEEKIANEVDVKAFREIEMWRFRQKIDYLYKNRILGDFSYRLLNKARKVRNRIHDEPIITEFSQQDYTLFNMASIVASQLWNATMIDWGKDISINLKSNAEKVAEQWLLTKKVSYEASRPKN
jgi:hypothetical protein